MCQPWRSLLWPGVPVKVVVDAALPLVDEKVLAAVLVAQRRRACPAPEEGKVRHLPLVALNDVMFVAERFSAAAEARNNNTDTRLVKITAAATTTTNIY